MLFLLDNGKECVFEQQIFYKNRRTFNKSMRQLINANWLNVRSRKINNYWRNVYKMTLNGRLVAEEMIKDFVDNND